jgi:hypothetical protein
MAKYSGSGWHNQSIRHSNARKYGRAGGTYANMSIPELRGKLETNNHLAYMNQSINKEFALKKLHENQEIALEIQKRIDEAQWDEIVRRDEMKTELANKEQEDYAKALKLYKKIGIKKHFGEAEKGETAGQVLERLSKSDTSSETDSKIMQALLQKTGLYPNAVVVYGIVYLDGKGTMKNPPTSIHAVAKTILRAVEDAKKGKNYGKTESKPIAIHFDSAFSGTEIVDVDVNGEWVKTRYFYPQKDKTIKGRIVKRKMNIDNEGVATFKIDKEKYSLNDFMKTGE